MDQPALSTHVVFTALIAYTCHPKYQEGRSEAGLSYTWTKTVRAATLKTNKIILAFNIDLDQP